MKRKEFREMLEKLHNELEQLDSVDDQDRELLGTVMDDIRQLVYQPVGDVSHQRNNLIEQLTEAMYHLEESHPTLVLSLKQLIDTLSNMGI